MPLLTRIAALLFAVLIVHANASAKARLAPADEYFGRMKMSVLEIGNRLHDLSRRNSAPASNVLHDAALTEDAMHAWEDKYPADPWLSKDISSLARIYAQLHTPAAQRRYRTTTSWLRRIIH